MSDCFLTRLARPILAYLSFAAIVCLALSGISRSARAQGCPQIVTGGGTDTSASSASSSSTDGSLGTLSAPCNTPPSIMINPTAGTITTGAPFFIIEYCSPNYTIDMSTNSVTRNHVRVDANDARPMPLMSMNPDTMPNSGFCGVPAGSGMTAQEIGRVPFLPGPDTIVAHVCDDIAQCTTKTNIYTYVPTFPVTVTPDGGIVRVFSAQADTAFFVIHRLDSDTMPGLYNLIRTCVGAAEVSCTGRDTVTLRGGESKTIGLAFTGGGGAIPAGGRVTLTATLSTNAAMTDAGSDSIVASSPGITITPDNVALNAAVNAHNTAFFSVINTGPRDTTFTFTGICSGADTACVASTASKSIAAGARDSITVGYKSEALGSTGSVKLSGVEVAMPSVTDVGTYNTTAVTPSVMTATDASAGATLERSLCLTVAAGHAAASECGELRLAHALPSIRTKNKSRTPTLIYTSGSAHPEVLVPLLVTLPASMPVPDSVTTTLTINSTVRASGKWTGLAWGYASTQRVVLGFDALSDSSGIYAWTAQASSWYGGTRYNSSVTSGELALVNRSRSDFGAGWWLAGLEKLYNLADGSKLWIGGDGSTRHFKLLAGFTNVWTDPLLNETDGLNFDGTNYNHILPHGLKVVFDATGRHIKTINRLKDTTTFFYTGQRLDSLQVPPTALGKRYLFTYDAQTPSRILTVVAPALPTRSRVTTIVTSGGRITSITEPDTTAVAFGYTPGDTNRIVTRTDRRGTVGTFSYNAAKLLVRDSIGMDTTGVPIVTAFRPGESVGWMPTSMDTALAYGMIDGPRTDVADTTLFWLDQYHEPRRIRNALGQDTKLTRGNASFPAVVTRLQAANGRVLLATYDGHGNIASSMDSATCISGTCATTTYLWNQTWDFLAKVTAPLGEVTLSSYETTYGNKVWQQPDADSAITSRRVTFQYDATWHLVNTVQEPLIAGTQRIWYDGAGNMDSTKTPTNIPTRFYLDSLGRDTLVKSAIDYGDTTWVYSTTTYDVSDQDVLNKTYSFPLRADSGTITHAKLFDAEGNVLRDSVRATPDTNHIGWVKHVWTYDRANRKRTEFPQGPSYGHDTFTYDAAGNVVSWLPRVGGANTTTYDVLNRPTQRVVPALTTFGLVRYTFGSSFLADTLTYAYDVASNMTTANNLFARITRVYNLNGTLAADTERLRESDSASAVFSHIYGVQYRYDLEGRRSWMRHPGTLANVGFDTVSYAYDATTGLLKSVLDPNGNRFGFAYDADLRLASDTATMTTGTVLLTTRSYDNESRLSGRHETQNGTIIVQDTMRFDARNKLDTATFRMPDGTTQTDVNGFGKLGPMTKNYMLAVWADDYVTDGLGHQRSRTSSVAPVNTTTSTYDAGGSAELMRVVRVPQTALRDTTAYHYDAAGELWTDTTLRQIGVQDPPIHPYSWFARQRVLNRYGSNLQMMASETAFDTIDAGGFLYGPQYYEHEEYRYDAMGRRIWRRLIRLPNCSLMNKSSGCISVVERTVWDGDQVLWEIRADGGDAATAARMEADGAGIYVRAQVEGRVMYTHGSGIDHPLSIGRLDNQAGVIVPQYDWRGNAVSGYCTVTTVCATQLVWPEKLQSPWAEDPSPSDTVYWAGNLISTHKDGSGYIYKRNRYYDPTSGRFTQVDPIGLAGGLNAYGFAGGDPINYADPFGLWAWTDALAQGVANWGARTGGVSGDLALNAGAVLNAGFEAFGLNAAADAGDKIGKGDVVGGIVKAGVLIGGAKVLGMALGAVARYGARSAAPSAENIVESVAKLGAKVKVHPSSGGAGEGVAIDFGEGTTADVRVETHPPHGKHGNVQVWKNGVEVQNTHVTQ